MPRHDCTHVVIAPHAQEQYKERGGSGCLRPRHVQGILQNQLAVGVEPIDLVVQVPVTRFLIALCSPQREGYWLCFTVLKKDWEVV